MKNKCIFIFLLFSTMLFSQTQKRMQGKISVKNSKLDGVRVINLMTEKEAITNQNGEFFILAKPDDLLVFSADFLDYMRKIVEVEDYNKGFLEIEMTSKIIQLDEVEIYDYSNINAVNLGILSRPAKQYTPAQRRLQTATRLHPTLYAGTMAGGSVGLDPLINWISGRTSMLKRALKAEEKEILLKKLENFYSDEFIIEKLKIRSIDLGRFKNYAVYDDGLINSIEKKDRSKVEFNLYRISAEFQNINAYED